MHKLTVYATLHAIMKTLPGAVVQHEMPTDADFLSNDAIVFIENLYDESAIDYMFHDVYVSNELYAWLQLENHHYITASDNILQLFSSLKRKYT